MGESVVYGYVRVSTANQNEQRQIKKMIELGVDKKHIYIDKASGKNLDRAAYRALLSKLKAGDSIIFDSLDRLGRNYFDIVNEWQRLTREKGVHLKCLDLEFFDSKKFSEMGAIGVCVEDMLLSLLAYVAQTEREKIRARQEEGIALAKAAGKYRGRATKELTANDMLRAQDALKTSKDKAAEVLGVGRATVYRMIKDGRLVG